MNKTTVNLMMLLLVLIFASCNGEDFKDTSQLHEFGVSDTIVSIDEARADLTQLLADLEVANGRSSVSKSIESAYTTGFRKNVSRAGESDFDVHVFNFANNGGFAVMSTDRR